MKKPQTRRQWNSTIAVSTKPIPRSSKPLVRFTKKRRTTEFARIYGSKARVRWVKSLPCIACVALHPLLWLGCGPSHNAHTETGGTGRKAGHETIVPLCPIHHRRYDEHLTPFDNEPAREAIKARAAKIAAAWLLIW